MRLVIGIDPGPVPGVAGLWLHGGDCEIIESAVFGFAQCDERTLYSIVAEWLKGENPDETVFALEKYIVSTRASRSATPRARDSTLRVSNTIGTIALRDNIRLISRPAATVKPWATDLRLKAAGLYTRTEGSTHARDATRHALYAACHDGGCADPLSHTTERHKNALGNGQQKED